ncbi:MAG: hypothetical protein KDE35_04165 [Geminicoccaceae bacterium]|nr:hypothetical protein [Geminicoccaceae bacterium]
MIAFPFSKLHRPGPGAVVLRVAGLLAALGVVYLAIRAPVPRADGAVVSVPRAASVTVALLEEAPPARAPLEAVALAGNGEPVFAADPLRVDILGMDWVLLDRSPNRRRRF